MPIFLYDFFDIVFLLFFNGPGESGLGLLILLPAGQTWD